MISTCSFDFLSEHKYVKGYEIGFVNFGKIFLLQPVDALEKALNVGFEVLDFLEKNIPLKTGKQYFVVILEKNRSVGLLKRLLVENDAKSSYSYLTKFQNFHSTLHLELFVGNLLWHMQIHSL